MKTVTVDSLCRLKPMYKNIPGGYCINFNMFEDSDTIEVISKGNKITITESNSTELTWGEFQKFINEVNHDTVLSLLSNGQFCGLIDSHSATGLVHEKDFEGEIKLNHKNMHYFEKYANPCGHDWAKWRYSETILNISSKIVSGKVYNQIVNSGSKNERHFWID